MHVSALVCAVWLYVGKSDFNWMSQLSPCCRPPRQSAPFGLFLCFLYNNVPLRRTSCCTYLHLSAPFGCIWGNRIFSSISQLPPCCRPPHQSAPFGLFFCFYTIMYLCGGCPVARICTNLRRLVVFGEIGFLAGYRNRHPVAALRTNLRRLVYFLLFIQ